MKIKFFVWIPLTALAWVGVAFTGPARAQTGDVAAAPSTVTELYRALVNGPPRTPTAVNEHREFCETLALFLRERNQAEVKPHLSLLLPALVRYAGTGAERNRLFRVLADPDHGVSTEEFVRLVMSGRFDTNGAPLRASRAFQLLTGNYELGAGEVTAHQMTILAGLGAHLVDYADLVALLRAPGPEPFLRNFVSQTVLSPYLSRYHAWPLTPHDWATILAFYDPTSVDAGECARVMLPFKSVRDARVAIANVPSESVRVCLQNAAVGQLGPGSAEVIRQMMAPIGLHTTMAYEEALWFAKEQHAISALANIIDPGSLTPPSAPSLPTPNVRCNSDLATRPVPAGWRVIPGGREAKPSP